MTTLNVKMADGSVAIDSEVFVALLANSVAHGRAGFRDALETKRISLAKLIELADVADIPYPLFFAPIDVVHAQLQQKVETLLAGVSKQEFSMNSRNRVELRDVELIVKDILRKQEFLKARDATLVRNAFVGSLNPRQSVEQNARALREALGFSVDEVKSARTKGDALELLISRFEAKQLFVSRSQQHYMPQLLTGVRFSGLCVRDKKIPYIFLTSGDAGENYEPTGRKVFTLVLLACLVGYSKFAPVTYDDNTAELITNREYLVTEEVLMPAAEVKHLTADTLEEVRAGADLYQVTPSAFVMRAMRLRLIDRDQADRHFAELSTAFAQRDDPPPRRPKGLLHG